MKYLIIVSFLLATALSALTVWDWHNIRFSGRTAANDLYLRTEITGDNLTVNKALVYNDTSIQEYDLGQNTPGTFQGILPVGTVGRDIGLRLRRGTSPMHVLPVRFRGTGLPAPAQLTVMNTDGQNETSTNYLDITSDYFTFSDSRFYGAIQNRGGGFPTSANFGTVYLTYMVVIGPQDINPDDPDAVVWAMIYMNAALAGITPGLYKITGTSISDVTRIGDITSQITTASNTLVMGCNISDLTGDPDFMAWYNPADPVVGVLSATLRTTVFPMATTQIDNTDGAITHLHNLYADPANTAPSVTQPELVVTGDDAYFHTMYSDNEGNFPLSILLERDDTTFDLYTDASDFSQPVFYRTANLAGILGEGDAVPIHTVASDNNIQYTQSAEGFYTYIQGLNHPENVTFYTDGIECAIWWDPVETTPSGTPVTVDHYRIEFSDNPDFTGTTESVTTTETGYIFPLTQFGEKMFFRVTAVK